MSKSKKMATVEVDIINVSQESAGHGKVRVTLVFEAPSATNFETELVEGEKTSIEIPSHAPQG